MTRINLLPWREERRKEKQRQFTVAIVAVILVATFVWGVGHFYYNLLIDFQDARIGYIDQQIKIVSKKISDVDTIGEEKEELLSRMRAIERLQSNRSLIVRLFDEVVSAVPEGVTLTRLEQRGSLITVEGLTQSNSRVSSFMRNIEDSEWLTDPDLKVIATGSKQKKNVETPINSFTLSFSQVLSKFAEDEEGS